MTCSQFGRTAACALVAATLTLGACSSSPSTIATSTGSAASVGVPATAESIPVTTDANPATTPVEPLATAAAAPTSTTATSTTAATHSATGAVGGASGHTAAGNREPPAPPSTIAGLLALGRPIVLAHTGGEDEFPGSTMFAFGESMRAGVDMLDLNVVLTADDVLVVQHDLTVDRLTEMTGAVADMTAAELARLDDAYWFTPTGSGHDEPAEAYVYRGVRTGQRPPPPGYTADDFAIPTLEELIRRYPTVTLNIELKDTGGRGAAAAAVLAGVLRTLGRADAAVVTSFDDATVDAFRAAAPGVEVSPGLAASAAWVLDGTPLPAGMRILQLPPEFNKIAVITPQSLAAAHDAGYLVWVWPNDSDLENGASYDRFLAEGCDGLNINFPAAGVAAVGRFAAT